MKISVDAIESYVAPPICGVMIKLACSLAYFITAESLAGLRVHSESHPVQPRRFSLISMHRSNAISFSIAPREVFTIHVCPVVWQ